MRCLRAFLAAVMIASLPCACAISFGAKRKSVNLGSADLMRRNNAPAAASPGDGGAARRFPAGVGPDGAASARMRQPRMEMTTGDHVGPTSRRPLMDRGGGALPGRPSLGGPPQPPKGLGALPGKASAFDLLKSFQGAQRQVAQEAAAAAAAGPSAGSPGAAPRASSEIPEAENARVRATETAPEPAPEPEGKPFALFDKFGNAKGKEDVLAFEEALLGRVPAADSKPFPEAKAPPRTAKKRAPLMDDSQYGQARRPRTDRGPRRMAKVNPEGHEYTSDTITRGFTGTEIGRTVDPHGKEYITHRVTDLIKKKAPTRKPEEMIVMDGDTHYETTTQERLYHYRIQNTGRDGPIEQAIFTATLPEGSKPHLMYWIRNKRGVRRPEHHECYTKRLVITCTVHNVKPGELATIYLHAKQRPSGHSEMVATLNVAGKTVTTAKL